MGLSMTASDRSLARVSRLIAEYAKLCGRTNTEVALALLGSKTLARSGYVKEQKGRLTEEQAQAAIAVLDYWIGARVAEEV